MTVTTFTTGSVGWDTSANNATVTTVVYRGLPPDDTGLAGVREPRRPLPSTPTISLEMELPR